MVAVYEEMFHFAEETGGRLRNRKVIKVLCNLQLIKHFKITGGKVYYDKKRIFNI